jgi:NADPH:quinone reductase-like Zn-dependent oxidoreductase
VTSAPIVPLDLLCASGTSYFGPPAVPYVPGVQGVGVVESSDALPAGTRVFFTTSAGMAPGDGSLGELCIVADEDLMTLTEPVPDAVAASLGLSAVAAWMALTWRADLRPGERVVVLGGGGAVGQVAVQAARLLGASRIVAVCRPGRSLDRATKAGPDEVVIFSDDVDRLTDGIAQALGSNLEGGADVIIDPVFGPAATAAARNLAKGGRLVNLGSASSNVAEFSSSVLRSRSVDILGYTNNALTPAERRKAVDAVMAHAATGAIAVDHQVLPLSQVVNGWRRTQEGSEARVVLSI